MRITTRMMANRSVYAINNSYEKMNKYQTQLETQKKINRPSDDPVVAMKGVKNRTELSGIEQYMRNNTEANAWIDATDTAYDEAKSLIQRMRELANNLANGTNNEQDRQAAAEELKQLKEQMIDIANTQIEGKYIFNGTDINIKPCMLQNDGTVTFAQGIGANGTVRVEVSRADGSDAMLEVNSLPTAFFRPSNSAGATATFAANTTVTAAGKMDITINGQKFSVDLAVGDDQTKIMDKINEAAVDAGMPPIAELDNNQIKLTSYTNNPAGGGMTIVYDATLQIGAAGAPAVTTVPYAPNANPAQPGLKRDTVFEEIDKLINAVEHKGPNGAPLSEGEASTAISHWLRTADQIIDRANLAMGEVGGKQNRMELVNSRNKSTELFVTKMLSENEDVNVEEVITDLSIQEMLHRASLAVSSKIIQPSLIDFLR